MRISIVIRLKMLAKGKRGIVFLKRFGGKQIVVKKKNPESTAVGRIAIEAKFLKLLNKYDIGPRFIYYKEDELGMEYIKGELFEEYTDNEKVVKEIFLQMYQMDKLGINKKEMHHPTKHIIIRDGKAVLIDFERCHYTEKPKNVSQFVQYIRRVFNLDNRILEAAKEYKKNPTKNNLNKIISCV